MSNFLNRIAFFTLPGLVVFGLVMSCTHSASAKIKVLVIDTGIDLKHSIFKDANIKCTDSTTCQDHDGHGTHIASLILNGQLYEKSKQPTAKTCQQVELHICNYYRHPTQANYIKCLQKAVEEDFFLVNLSSSGDEFIFEEFRLIEKISAKGTLFVTASGNDGVNMLEEPRYPAMYGSANYINYLAKRSILPIRNVISVSGLTSDGKRWAKANRGPNDKLELATKVFSAYIYGNYKRLNGTSQATALYSNKLLRLRCSELETIGHKNGRPVQ